MLSVAALAALAALQARCEGGFCWLGSACGGAKEHRGSSDFVALLWVAERYCKADVQVAAAARARADLQSLWIRFLLFCG